MSERQRQQRRIAALGAVALLLATLTAWLSAPAALAAAVGPGAVELTIQDVRPNSPALSNSPPQPLQISMTLTNTTDEPLKDVTISAIRSDPIFTQKQLDTAIAKPKPPSEALAAPLTTKKKVTLVPHATTDVIYRTKTDIANDSELCLCANAIYPLYFTADYPSADGAATQLATAQTYVPSFIATPAKAKVGWLWPLLDRPHRLTSDTVFTDDDLANEVRSGGRLDQLLTVVEQVAGKAPMTLVTDPDLIDELAVMSTGYKVQPRGAPAVTGTGGPAAAAWLQRLRDVLETDKKMELVFTPYADPAIESLSRNGLGWSSRQSSVVQSRVADALGVSTRPTDIAWPTGGALSAPTLATLVGQDTTTVVVGDKSLPRGSASKVVPDALAPLRTRAGTAVAAVTSTPIERWVSRILEPGGRGLPALPDLVAELAVRVVISPDRSHYVLITPPRNLTVDPELAVRTILATSVTSWASPLPLRAAVGSITPVDHGRLRNRAGGSELPSATIQSLRYVTQALPDLGSLFTTPAVRATQLGALPIAMQRCESTSLLLQDPPRSAASAERLERRIVDIRNGVFLVPPSEGTYTLTSKRSQLPVTVVNQLPEEVRVKINVSTQVPGLTVDDHKVRTLRANSKIQLPVPTTVDRVGRFDVQVTLSTPDGLSLGRPIPKLTVRSTALGTIGIVITIAAAVVLALALLVRFVRRIMKRRSPKPPPEPEPEPVPVTTASP